MTEERGFARLLGRAIALAALAAGLAAAAAEIPPMARPVTDAAKVFDEGTLKALETELREMRSAATNPVQMASLTLPTLGGETVEALAQKVFAKWQLGEKGKDNGLLYLFALKEKKYRIHTGYGIEGLIPDGKAGQLGRLAVPEFKKGNYAAGVKKVVAGVHVTLDPSAAEGVYGRMPETRPRTPPDAGPGKKKADAEETRGAGYMLGGVLVMLVLAWIMLKAVWSMLLQPIIQLVTSQDIKGGGGGSGSDDDDWRGSSGGGSSSSDSWSGGGGSSGGGGASGGW